MTTPSDIAPDGRFKSRPLSERFWEKVDKRGADECWPWTGTLTNKGRGQIWNDGRLHTASRVAWELHHGKPIPDGKAKELEQARVDRSLAEGEIALLRQDIADRDQFLEIIHQTRMFGIWREHRAGYHKLGVGK